MSLHIHLYPAHGETFIVMHDDAHRLKALTATWHWVNNRELSFTLSDFAAMGLKILGKSEVECEGR